MKDLDIQVGEALGWVRYPSDSVECGDTWHIEPDKAPFGKIRHVDSFCPSTDWDDIMPLVDEYWIALAKHQHREGKACEPYWIAAWTHPIQSLHYTNRVEGKTAQEAACNALIQKLEYVNL